VLVADIAILVAVVIVVVLHHQTGVAKNPTARANSMNPPNA
jgi:hypothetical protein